VGLDGLVPGDARTVGVDAQPGRHPVVDERAEPATVTGLLQCAHRLGLALDELPVTLVTGLLVDGDPKLDRLLPIVVGGEHPQISLTIRTGGFVDRGRGEHCRPVHGNARRGELGEVAGRPVNGVDAEDEVSSIGELGLRQRAPSGQVTDGGRIAEEQEVPPVERRLGRCTDDEVIAAVNDVAALQGEHHQVGAVPKRVRWHPRRLTSGAVIAPLVSVPEVAAKLAAPQPPLLLDVRYRLGGPHGRPAYELAHLPGAVYVDMDTELAGTPGPRGEGGRHPMPTAGAFGAAMRRAGVVGSRTVVAYDDWSGLPASRAWWLLRYFGHSSVQVLNGGIGAWQAGGYDVESGTVEPVPGDFEAVPGGRTLIDADGARRLTHEGRLLDGRPGRRFLGLDETVDPVAGHIPGAVSAPALENVRSDGRFLPLGELRAKLSAAVGGPDAEVGTYCGSGIQAAHLALALAATGLAEDAAVYAGSWSDWITDPDRGVELG